MNNEFKKIKNKNETRYVLETATAGATSSSAIATSTSKIGELRRRLQELKDKISVPKSKPRNPVGMGATQGRGTKKHQDSSRQRSRDEKKLSVDENNEMDHEISMASNELKSIAKDALNLLMLIKQKSEQEGLEAWQQSKITKAADYMNSVLQSISGDEEQGVAEGSLNELSKDTLKSYTKKANDEVNAIKKKQADHPRGHISGADADKKLNRQIGINQATKRIVKKDLTGVAEALVGDVVVHNYTKMPIDLKPGQAQIHGWGPNDQPLYRVKGLDGKEVITSNKKKMMMIAQKQGVAEGSDHDDDYSTASFEKWKKQKEYEKEYDKKKPAKPIVPDNKDKKKDVAEGPKDTKPGWMLRQMRDRKDPAFQKIADKQAAMAALKQPSKNKQQGVAEGSEQGPEVYYMGRLVGWKTGERDGRILFKPNPSELPDDVGRTLSLPVDKVNVRGEQGVAEGSTPNLSVLANRVKSELVSGDLDKVISLAIEIADDERFPFRSFADSVENAQLTKDDDTRRHWIKTALNMLNVFIQRVQKDMYSNMQQGMAEGSYTTEKQILTRIRQIMHDRKLSGTESNAGELNRLKQHLKDMRSQKNVAEGDWGWDDPRYERPKHERNPDWDREHEQSMDRPKINLRPSQDVIDAEKKAAQIKQAELQRTMAALARMRGDTSEDVAEDDPLAARQKYAEKHGQGQVYKSTYPGDKKGMTKAYAYDIKRTGPKGPLPKEEGVSEEDNAKSYQGKGNHRPGWMLKADPELAKKFKEKEKLVRQREKAYGDPTAGKSVGEGLRDPKDNPCWKGYKPVGTKKKGGRTVPNCVPKEGMDVEESGLQYHTGVKKHGKEYMVKAAQAARKGASQAELGALKDKYSKAYKNKQNEDTYVSKLQGMLEQLKKN